MPTLPAIRNAIETTISDNIASLQCYDNVPDVVQIPPGGAAVVVIPKEVDFAVAMGRGTDTWEFDLFVLVARTETENAQEILDLYVSGSGTKSIRQVIFLDPSLGSVVDHSMVKKMSGYGGSFDAKLPHIGARLSLTVLASGTS